LTGGALTRRLEERMVNLDEGGRGRTATRLLPPPASLAPWVEYFWVQGSRCYPNARPWRIVPDGNAHIIFYVESADEGERSGCCLVGARPTHHDIDVSRRQLTIGARLRLATLARLTRSGGDQFTGRSIRVDDIFGATGRALADRMSQGDEMAAVRHLVAFLEARVAPFEADAHFDDAVRSARTVGSLASLTNLSSRGIYARAVEVTGLGPKRLLRIARLHRALVLAQARGAAWAEAAYRAGYADQAHMVREFRSLLGEAPEAWRHRSTADSFNTRIAQTL
jgi:AraC-like DNA-binding protein